MKKKLNIKKFLEQANWSHPDFGIIVKFFSNTDWFVTDDMLDEGGLEIENQKDECNGCDGCNNNVSHKFRAQGLGPDVCDTAERMLRESYTPGSSCRHQMPPCEGCARAFGGPWPVF